jgi:hypothetical protein
MKKALLITLAVIVMLAPACTTQPTSNNGNGNGNISKTGNSNSASTTSVATPAIITITYNVTADASHNVVIIENCTGCTSPTPTVKVGGTLNWNVMISGFGGTDTPAVTIDGFKTVSTSPSGDWAYTTPAPGTDVFSPSSSNKPPFSYKPGDLPKASIPGTKGTYKYSVIVKWQEGGTARQITIDPRVVFDDM